MIDKSQTLHEESLVDYYINQYYAEDIYYDWEAKHIVGFDHDDLLRKLHKLKLYNKYNCYIFNKILNEYRIQVGRFPSKEDWPAYLECKESITIGEDQSTIYNNIVSCFSQEIVNLVIIDKDEFLSGIIWYEYDDPMCNHANDELSVISW